ncbi:unnamed protein product [Protopolystoma xenopodis]|uniref:Uncharacterized protein n=1 Tax=Protopolystoma xenopodis TaxID=117903 RepID=A0A3S5A8S8_9PLAT|nr:unnamed protein product [Protopolystoma xenopodis]
MEHAESGSVKVAQFGSCVDETLNTITETLQMEEEEIVIDDWLSKPSHQRRLWCSPKGLAIRKGT